LLNEKNGQSVKNLVDGTGGIQICNYLTTPIRKQLLHHICNQTIRSGAILIRCNRSF